MHRRLRYSGTAALTVGLAAMLAACSTSPTDKTTTSSASSPAASGSAAEPSVSLKLLQFAPAKLTVKAGTTVTWRNDEPITHTVTSGSYAGANGPSGLRTSERPNGLFNDRLATKDATATYTFAQPGTYPYYCDIHKGMNATVVVTP